MMKLIDVIYGEFEVEPIFEKLINTKEIQCLKRSPRLLIYSVTSIICFSLTGCGNVWKQADSQQVASEEPLLEATLESEIGKFSLSEDTEKFLFGKWKVKKLLGFYESWNDASEYLNGQDIIGNELIIQSDFFHH